MRLRQVLALGTLMLAVYAAPATAAPFTPELNAAYARAAEWWGATPTGCSSITLELVPGTTIEAAGRATQPEAGEPPTPCFMRIAEGLDACYQPEVVLHEYGHLLGYGHSEDPTNIMFPGQRPNSLCHQERAAEFHDALRREGRRCQQLRPSRHRRECWRGLREESHAYAKLLASV